MAYLPLILARFVSFRERQKNSPQVATPTLVDFIFVKPLHFVFQRDDFSNNIRKDTTVDT